MPGETVSETAGRDAAGPRRCRSSETLSVGQAAALLAFETLGFTLGGETLLLGAGLLTEPLGLGAAAGVLLERFGAGDGLPALAGVPAVGLGKVALAQGQRSQERERGDQRDGVAAERVPGLSHVARCAPQIIRTRTKLGNVQNPYHGLRPIRVSRWRYRVAR